MVLAGCMVRACFVLQTKIHFLAHDQLAWETGLRSILAEKSFAYKTLIHYPHEGGTLLLSLFTWPLMVFLNVLPALSVTAFLYDTVSRYLQILIVQKLYGTKPAWLFGLWTVAAIPAMLPWSGAFFGLHNSGVWPFLFLLLTDHQSGRRRSEITAGAFTGLAISFTYHNVVFVPAYILTLFLSKYSFGTAFRRISLFLFTVLVFMLPHILTRKFADNGFPFEPDSILSAGRPTIGEFHMTRLFQDLADTLIYFSRSLLLPIKYSAYSIPLILMLCFILLPSVILWRQKRMNGKYLLPFFLIILYLLIYTFSSMFELLPADGRFYTYRHFVYITPLFFLWLFISCEELPSVRIIAGAFILIGLFLSIRYFLTFSHPPPPNYKVAGWILVRKYGDEPERLLSVYESARDLQQKKDLVFGYSWGYTTHLLYRKELPPHPQAEKVIRFLQQLPWEHQEEIEAGVHFAFDPAVTPVLPSEVKPMIMSSLQKNHYEK